MTREQVVRDGRHRAQESKDYAARCAEVEAEVRRTFAPRIEAATGLRRYWLHWLEYRAIRREIDRLAPRGALYSRSDHALVQ